MGEEAVDTCSVLEKTILGMQVPMNAMCDDRWEDDRKRGGRM